MKKHSLVIGLFYFIVSLQATAQLWEKSYGIEGGINQVLETYDNGLLLAGNYNIPSFLIKTDINGGILWKKHIGTPGKQTTINAITVLSDNSIIISGLTMEYDFIGDPFLLKLNACGEKEWCRIYRFPSYNSFLEMQKTKNDNFFVTATGFYRDWLTFFQINSNGIFENQLTTDFNYCRMALAKDSSVLATGWTYKAEANPNALYIKSGTVKIDEQGVLLWQSLYGVKEKIAASTDRVIECTNGEIITIGGIDKGHKFLDPFVIKRNANGEIIKTHEYPRDTKSSYEEILGIIEKNSLELINIFSFTQDPNPLKEKDLIRFIKTDTGFNELERVEYGDSTNYWYQYPEFITLSEGKFLLTLKRFNKVTKVSETFVAKFKNNLKQDSLVADTRKYDFDCPHPIKSDTIRMDDADTVILNIDTTNVTALSAKEFLPKQYFVAITPNPFSDYITISSDIPMQNGYLVEITDIIGKSVKVLKAETLDTPFYLGDLHKGIYFIKISDSEGHYTSTQKLIKH